LEENEKTRSPSFAFYLFTFLPFHRFASISSLSQGSTRGFLTTVFLLLVFFRVFVFVKDGAPEREREREREREFFHSKSGSSFSSSSHNSNAQNDLFPAAALAPLHCRAPRLSALAAEPWLPVEPRCCFFRRPFPSAEAASASIDIIIIVVVDRRIQVFAVEFSSLAPPQLHPRHGDLREARQEHARREMEGAADR
jgi:hypothetical protein